MKLSDFLSDVGRPVAFYPSLVKALGDRNEAIFICQMAYWRGKGEKKDDWIYKTAYEIEAETSLTYKEQTNVRNGLKKKGLLQEHNARTEHKMYFRVGWDKVNSIWEQFTDGNMPITGQHLTKGKQPSSPKSTGSLPEVISLNSNTENTQKNTTEIAAAPRPLSNSETQEVKTEANKTVDGILENERIIQEKDNAGQVWRGRELCPPNYLIYGDWWHAKTQQHMYGTKGKQKINSEWLKAFKEFYEHDIPLSVLDETYEAEIAWKKIISKPSELITKAIAIAALPPVKDKKESLSPFDSLFSYLQKTEGELS